MNSTTVLASALVAGLTSAVFAGAGAQWDFVASTADAGVP